MMWVLLPNDDPIGSRVMPSFRGMGGGPQDGGPLMVVEDQEIDMFFLPTGVRPGNVLEVGDTFSFSGHVAPPLDGHVEEWRSGLSDEILITLFLVNDEGSYRANTVTLFGEEVFVTAPPPSPEERRVFLPLILKGG